MTITLQSLIYDIREMLRDLTSPYHYSDLKILNGIVDAFRTLFDTRPESKYDENGRLIEVGFPSAESDLKALSIFIEGGWRLGIVYFATARCYEADITDTVNMQLASTLKQQAMQIFAS